MIPRFVETIYCDDVREELGGKVSYIGVYKSALVVNDFPALLPKFFVLVNVQAPATDPIHSLVVSIYKDDELVEQVEMEKEEFQKFVTASESWTDDEKSTRIQSVNATIHFSPLVFENECILRVRAETEREEIPGRSLRIVRMQSPESLEEAPSS